MSPSQTVLLLPLFLLSSPRSTLLDSLCAAHHSTVAAKRQYHTICLRFKHGGHLKEVCSLYSILHHCASSCFVLLFSFRRFNTRTSSIYAT